MFQFHFVSSPSHATHHEAPLVAKLNMDFEEASLD